MENEAKIAAELKLRWMCDTHVKTSCVVKDNVHVRLIPKDFSAWATMIVSHRLHITSKSHQKLTWVGSALWQGKEREVPRFHH